MATNMTRRQVLQADALAATATSCGGEAVIGGTSSAEI